MGLDLNLKKTELHFLSPENPATIPPALPATLQTLFFPPTPVSGYTYLGVFLSDLPDFDHLSYINTRISSFFATLNQYPLLATEKVHLCNTQLLHRIRYSLSHNQLPFSLLHKLQSFIW